MMPSLTPQNRRLCFICKGLGTIGLQLCPKCKGHGYILNKFNNQKTEYKGVMYDSKKEANKAGELDILKQTGDVIEWTPHPSFIVIPRFIKNGKIFRPTRYEADFLVKYKDGREEVIDIKGFKTVEWRIKKKLFEWRYSQYSLKVE